MADSIYNVPEHNSSNTYAKNAIVFTQDPLQAGTGVPKNIKYYYARQDVPSSTAITSLTYWGGYTTISSRRETTLPQFIWTPSYNLSVNQQPKVNSIVLGNGYEQRVPDGIYNNLIRLELSFDMRTELEARAIAHFLRTRKGSQSFAVQHLPEIYQDSANYVKRFYCPSFNTSFAFHDNYTIKATFVETNN
jgi:phage-related protein